MRNCPYCGGLVQDGATACGFCGKELGISSVPPPPPGYGSAGTRYCVACGRPIPFEANVCPYCGHDYRIASGLSIQSQKTWKPTAAGILIIIAGILAIAMGALYMSLDVADFEDLGVALPPEFTAEDLAGLMDICGVVLFVFAIIAIIGGIFGIQRKHFGFAIAGGVFGLLGIGFFLGSLLALVGLILVAISRREFQ